jgi:putative glutamine amidotransferase
MMLKQQIRPVIWQPNAANGHSFLLPCLGHHTPFIALVTYLHRLNQNEQLSRLSPDWMPKPEECFEWETWLDQNKKAQYTFKKLNKTHLALIVTNNPDQYSEKSISAHRTFKRLRKYQTTPLFLLIASCHGLCPNERNLFYDFIVTQFQCIVHLGGHSDVHPLFYNEQISYASDCVDIMDYYEIELIRNYYYKSKGFILGFCRGMQICNVAFGGTLFQDLKKLNVRTSSHQESQHRIIPLTTKNNILKKLTDNSKNILVNSYHHQGVKKFNSNIFQVAATETDGTIEALEFKNGRGIIVQFHPELDETESWHRLFFASRLKI